MIPDSELLRSYADQKSETAFAEVAQRHLNFVYSTALRLANGETHLAEDITQSVFTEMARNARRLSRHPSLAGWLHTTTRFTIRNVRVSESRRRRREREAVMEENTSTPNLDWERLQPVLDDAVGSLDRLDREVVLLRFFEVKSHREIGDLLGLQENAARMRVERALEKLRKYFLRRGVRATATLLASTIAANSVQAAPVGLATGISKAALAKAAAVAGPAHFIAKGLFAMSSKTKVALVAAALVATGFAPIGYHYFWAPYHPALNGQTLATLFDPPVSDVLVSANNKFAIDLYKQLVVNSTDNIFFSPYSISSGLAMTWAGARGQTADQLAKALHLDGLPATEVAKDFGVLQRALARDSNRVQLVSANSLWAQQGTLLADNFLHQIEHDYVSEALPVDFIKNPDAADDKINAWITDKTNRRISGIIQPGDIDPLTRLILVNAIYFKGDWINKFDPALTQPRPFHLANGEDKRIPMMFQDEKCLYAEISDGPVPMQILSLPYKGGMLSLVVLLPIADYDINGVRAASVVGGDLSDLEKSLSEEALATWLASLRPDEEKRGVLLPKFKLTGRFDLNRTLNALGIQDAFAKTADFSGMDGSRDLYLAKSMHQAYLDVNEEGTEAAAASWDLIPTLAMARPFVADHPFLFLIRDNRTGSILFMGRFATPP